jgi:hypothetical protein
MNMLKTIWREFFAIFVDDGNFSLTILIWLGLLRLALPYVRIPAMWHAAILFLGLAGILGESVLRRSRKQ